MKMATKRRNNPMRRWPPMKMALLERKAMVMVEIMAPENPDKPINMPY